MIDDGQGKIVAIGGGEIRLHETFGIDEEIVRLTGKPNPSALFIPTAGNDSEEYWHAFDDMYGRRLGCRTDVLYLLHQDPGKQLIEDKILSADLVYVGGGNTLRMMRRWRRLGVDRVLRKAHENGAVLSGLSAGAVCWFSHGHSDSQRFYDPDNWDYIRVTGIGLINALAVCHYTSEDRADSFNDMVAKHRQTGVALDNNSALIVRGDEYRVMTCADDASAYRVFVRGKEVVREEIEPTSGFRPLVSLLSA
ncbi:MAG: Type 1 glutamine amidotransferase-like domain-containing protein [Chloroflexota bacterium]